MFNKIKFTIAIIFCCFFQDAQGYYTREQLENYLGKPVFSCQHMIDLIVVEEYLYTTELSKILLIGDSVFFNAMKLVPAIGSIFLMLDPIVHNRFFDTRFETFIKNIEKYSQEKLQEAIKDAVLLSSASTQGYFVHNLLDYLSKTLRNKIIFIKRQNVYNKYLEEYLELFVFVQKLKIALEKDQAISFTLDNGCTVTLKVQKDFFGRFEGLSFDWDH